MKTIIQIKQRWPAVLFFLLILFSQLLNYARAQKTQKKKTPVNKATDVSPKTATTPKQLPVKPVEYSQEADAAVESQPNDVKKPPAIRKTPESKVAYRQKLWRDIVLAEKQNQSLQYPGDEGTITEVLLRAVNDGSITAYSAIDDRFTTKLSVMQVHTLIWGSGYIQRIPDRKRDPNGDKGIFMDTLLYDDPQPIYKIRVMEDWIWDNERSTMQTYIGGIALVELDTVTIPGERLDRVLFWMPYRQVREVLATQRVYNAKNLAAPVYFDQYFDSRMYSGYVVKSSYNNPRDLYLDQMPGLKDNNILRLWEGENIKNRVFDYEQNLWSY
jgi:gliding motility associated protien GldN